MYPRKNCENCKNGKSEKQLDLLQQRLGCGEDIHAVLPFKPQLASSVML